MAQSDWEPVTDEWVPVDMPKSLEEIPTASRERLREIFRPQSTPPLTTYQGAAKKAVANLTEQGGPLVGGIAQAVIPQNEAELLSGLGVGAGQAVAAKAGMRAIPAALSRILGGAVGGELGGMAAREAKGQGGAIGALTGATGEAMSTLGGYIARRIPPVRRAFNTQQAAQIGETLQSRVPTLPNIRTPEAIDEAVRSFERGKGPLLDAYKAKTQMLEARLGGKTLNVPTLEAGLVARSGGSRKAGGGVTLEELKEALSQSGQSGYGGVRADPNLRSQVGEPSRIDYATLMDEAKNALQQIDPSGAAAKTFLQSRSDLTAGLSALDLFRKTPSMVRSPTNVQLNIPALQEYVQKYQDQLQSRLGTETFEELKKILWRGGGMGTRDLPLPAPGEALHPGSVGATMGGGSRVIGTPLRSWLPHLGTQYAGEQPIKPSGGFRAVIDYLTQRGLAPFRPQRRYQE